MDGLVAHYKNFEANPTSQIGKIIKSILDYERNVADLH
jgi:hypothetical protein